MSQRSLLEAHRDGLFCAAGGFFVDPWRPVERAVITHAHADHARPGSRSYLCTTPGEGVLRRRVGDGARIETLAYGETRMLGDVKVSLLPAGHLLGSAQVRLERRGEVWVVSGDYKTVPEATCEAFEPIRCDVFITESTFGLPVYRWPDQHTIFAEIQSWWQGNRDAGRTSVLFVYALGKAQRVLAGIDCAAGPVVAHGAIRVLCDAYLAAGVELPVVAAVDDLRRDELRRALVLAPPSAQGSPWMRRFDRPATAFASGWMQLRGPRRRRAVERGFVLSDHADWQGLLDAVAATGAERVGVTHGTADSFSRWLNERGTHSWVVATRYDGELGAEEEQGGGE